jgi:hypothetical protein
MPGTFAMPATTRRALAKGDSFSGTSFSLAKYGSNHRTNKVLAFVRLDSSSLYHCYVSRALSSADIKVLIDTAMNLNSRSFEHQKHRRGWMALSGWVRGLLRALIDKLLPLRTGDAPSSNAVGPNNHLNQPTGSSSRSKASPSATFPNR